MLYGARTADDHPCASNARPLSSVRGALDSRTGHQILGLLRGASTELGQTVVMVTHDPIAAAQADRVLFLADGRLAGHLEGPTAEAIARSLTDLGQW